MKKIFYAVLIVVILLVIATFFIFDFNKGSQDDNNKKNSKKLEKIKVAEVAHTVFYAPQYIAKGLGFFEEEGLDVQFILTPGADNKNVSINYKNYSRY